MKIGIPRAMAYYKFADLWQGFFNELNVETVLSQHTTKQILSDGIKYSVDECCLPSKIFVGHVMSLIGKADYILIPRIESFGKNEMTCVKFNALYDIIKSTFNVEILDYNIDVIKGHTEEKGFLEMGKVLGFTRSQTFNAYRKAKFYQLQCEHKADLNQRELLKSRELKIMVCGHAYNIYDKLIGYPVINYLEKLGVKVILANACDSALCIKSSKNLSKNLYWTFNKELTGAVEIYKNDVDGIIFLSAFPCGPDSLVNELLQRKLKGKPMLNLIIDELHGEGGLYTRLESFVDILSQKRQASEQRSLCIK